MTTCRCALLCISMPQSSLKAVKHAADTVMVLKSNCLRTNLQVCAALHRHATKLPQGCKQPESWVRLILEKPFGRDLCSSEALAGV
jgi:glucose-6-phosphate 1-dehydrogenase